MAATQVAPRIWFGSAGTTHTEPTRFTHIINVESSPNSTSSKALLHVGHSRFLFLHSDDYDDFPIIHLHLHTLCTWITAALREDPKAQIYIHCFAGINRSAALAIGYVCEIFGLAAEEVIPHVRSQARRLVLMNRGFEDQLREKFPPKREV